MFEYGFAETANALVDEFGHRDSVVADVDEEVVAAIRGLVALRAVADDLLARLTDQAGRLGIARRSGMTLRELLCINGIAPSVASRLIRLGAAREVLPALARHSRDGTLSAEHLDAVARGVGHVAGRTGDVIGSEAIDAVQATLIGVALVGSPAEVTDRARAIAIAATASEEVERDIPVAEDTTLNEFGWCRGADGRLRGEFDVDVLTGERLITALDVASRPRPEPDGSPDARSATRRRADAFAQFLETATRTAALRSSSMPSRTEVTITIPVARGLGDGESVADDIAPAPATLGWMGPISEFTARLASCDASVTGVGLDLNGSPLDMSPTARLFTGALRKIIDLRDQVCIKCGGPASWADCHHIVHYADGGTTTVDNGCLLCRSCHTAVHHSGWDVVMGADRHPWLIPPASVDAQRRPLPAYNRRTMRLDDAIAA